MKVFKGFSIILIAVFVSGVSLCLADSAKETFFRANREYDDANFPEAIRLYEELISKDIISGNIYYNLGNAYYKMGKKGKALLNYERAKSLIPDSEDLFANISFVTSSMDFEQPKEQHSLPQRIWAGIRGAVSVKAWFFISAIIFFSVCLILGIGFINYHFRARSHMISGILSFVFIVTLVFFISSYNAGKRFDTGVIIVPEAEVRYSPSYSGVTAFKLTEGMKAQIIRRQGEWTHIRLTKEKSGWVESDAIEAI